MNWSFKYISLYFFRSIELNKLKQVSGKFDLFEPILDLGCGDGKFTKDFFGECKDITGIDISPLELHKNRCYHTYTHLINMDATNMLFDNETFNTVFSNCVIEHIPDLEALLDEVWRVLKPNGLFVFTVPSDKFKHFLLFSPISKWYADIRNRRLNHFHCHNHIWWGHCLQRKGLKLKTYEYYLSQFALMFWDFLALITFHFWFLSFPFAKLFYGWVEKGIKKYSEERIFYPDGAALVVVARKEIK